MVSNAAEIPWQEPRPTDNEIIALVRDGDIDAFAILVDCYYQQVARHLAYRCSDPDLAADLTQETFAEAFRDLDRFEGTGSFAAWLYAVAHNRLRMHWRRQRIRRIVSLDWLMGSDAVTPAGLQEPDGSTQCHERVIVSRVLADLAPSLREALLLHSLDGFTAPEIATILGISRSAAERRVSRAKAQFRELYRDQHHDT